ncbi:type I-B CRISPR-associated protein Cas5b [Limosilactobacillus caccae]|uniref:type I-B CRISPR-associated protein Cas5b n=1 Tax=Limosilactobacillus caccae TaxID=1926284 RepID=UPI0009711E84|nr:type I-B CRISPR-associated protein Cas5b [Limosilactobacillus caccae]
MKAIKFNVYQQTANYRVPVSHDFRETYPLPPYSTVIGMVHFLCDFKKYHPMTISIQGKSASSTSDFFTRYEFKNGMKFDPKRHQLNAEGFGISRGIGHTQLLVDVNLTLHVIPQNQDEVPQIFQALKYPREYPSLGRREDLATISNVKIVEIASKEVVGKDYQSDLAAYIPQYLLSGGEKINLKDKHGSSLSRGTTYDLTEKYKLVETRKGKFERRWRRVPALYLSNYRIFEEETFLFDDDGTAVFPSIDIQGDFQ